AGRKVVHERLHSPAVRRAAAEDPAGDRREERRYRLGGAAEWTRRVARRNIGDGRRYRVLLRRQQRLSGRGRGDRVAALAFPHEPPFPRLADDLRIRRPAVCRGGRGAKHNCLRFAAELGERAVVSCLTAGAEGAKLEALPRTAAYMSPAQAGGIA